MIWIGGDGVDRRVVVDLWSYGCAVLRNKRRNLDRHQRVEEKYNIPLEEVVENPEWREVLSCRSKAFPNRYHCIIRFMGEVVEFTNEALVMALSCLDERALHVVLLYYGMGKTDQEICSFLGMKSRSLVQYHRRKAIEKLRKFMGELEDDGYVLL